MRVRATSKALALRLDGDETPEAVRAALEKLPELPLEVEVAGFTPAEVVLALLEAARGREVTFRPPRGPARTPATEVVPETVRAGRRVNASGTVVVLGDVNPGGEVVAAGDVIVVGKLRGLAHAGAGGNREAAIWALSIEAKQLRIADLVARAPEEGFAGQGPERAVVREGRIVLEPWGKGRR